MAVRVLREYMNNGHRYTLVLRGFNDEARFEAQRLEYAGFTANRPPLEDLIVSSIHKMKLTDSFRFLAIENPASVLMAGGLNKPEFPRLMLSGHVWQECVSRLVQSASAILFVIQEITPGVSTELQILNHTGNLRKAVIVLPKRGDRALYTQIAAHISAHSPATFIELPLIEDTQETSPGGFHEDIVLKAIEGARNQMIERKYEAGARGFHQDVVSIVGALERAGDQSGSEGIDTELLRAIVQLHEPYLEAPPGFSKAFDKYAEDFLSLVERAKI
jgi:hypothetical protein